MNKIQPKYTTMQITLFSFALLHLYYLFLFSSSTVVSLTWYTYLITEVMIIMMTGVISFLYRSTVFDLQYDDASLTSFNLERNITINFDSIKSTAYTPFGNIKIVDQFNKEIVIRPFWYTKGSLNQLIEKLNIPKNKFTDMHFLEKVVHKYSTPIEVPKRLTKEQFEQLSFLRNLIHQ
jgi:hypothetical protein